MKEEEVYEEEEDGVPLHNRQSYHTQSYDPTTFF